MDVGVIGWERGWMGAWLDVSGLLDVSGSLDVNVVGWERGWMGASLDVGGVVERW